MKNTYQYTRLEPLVTSREVNGKMETVIESMVVGMTAVSPDGYSAYVDTMVPTPLDPGNFIKFDEIDEAWAKAHGDAVAEDKDWKNLLDKQIEAAKARPISKPFAWQAAKAES